MMDMNQLQQACYALLEAEEHIYDNVRYKGETGESVQHIEERASRTEKANKGVLPKAVGCAVACAAGFVLTSRGMTGWLPQLMKLGGGAGALLFGAQALKGMGRKSRADDSLKKAQAREEANKTAALLYEQDKAAARAAHERRYLQPLLDFAALNPPPEGTKLFFQIPYESIPKLRYQPEDMQEMGALNRNGNALSGFAAPQEISLDELQPWLERPDCECFYINQALLDPGKRYTLSFLHQTSIEPQWEDVLRDRGGQVNVDSELGKFSGRLDDVERSYNGGKTHSDQYYSGDRSYGSYAASQQRREKAMNEARSAMEQYNDSRTYYIKRCRKAELTLHTFGLLLRNDQGRLVCAAAFKNGLTYSVLEYDLRNSLYQDTPKAEQEQVLASLTGHVTEERQYSIPDSANVPASVMNYVAWKCAGDLTPYNPLELKHPGLSDRAFRFWHQTRYLYMKK